MITSLHIDTNQQKAILAALYKKIRKQTEDICQPLKVEDYVLQPIPDVSPPKWHLGHTTWFFETFVLKNFVSGYTSFHAQFDYLFNSYYHHVGERWQRTQRGDLSRPLVSEVYAYRKRIDESILELIDNAMDSNIEELYRLIELGLNHEQQHQELLLYDIKYILASNPLFPAYLPIDSKPTTSNDLPDDYFSFTKVNSGIYEVGHADKSFAFDNEMPTQNVFLHDFGIRNGLVTNEEYLEFIKDGGYEDFKYWLDDGWAWLTSNQIKSPLYWHLMDGDWHEMTLHGLLPLNLNAPVTHISFYEAEAFATYRSLRLPTEFEWEIACQKIDSSPKQGNFLEDHMFHPTVPNLKDAPVYQIFGDVWEWTQSSYLPYHGYKPAPGALGEYNGKFMINQMVLRGGSCATPRDHMRASYRNFFHPDKRWAFSGLRLANQ